MYKYFITDRESVLNLLSNWWKRIILSQFCVFSVSNRIKLLLILHRSVVSDLRKKIKVTF